jgi:hypothetical protein
MSEDRYVIVQRQAVWWAVLDGNRFGPYPTREDAANFAVAQAKLKEPSGQVAEVSWEDRDGDPIFYRSPQED